MRGLDRSRKAETRRAHARREDNRRPAGAPRLSVIRAKARADRKAARAEA